MKPPIAKSFARGLAAAALLAFAPAPAARAQEAMKTATAAAATAPAIVPAPTPTPAPAANAEAPEQTETEIVATEGADFDTKNRVAVFNGAVHVTDSRFELWCDKLTVYMNKTSGPKEKAPGEQTPTPAPSPTRTPPAAAGQETGGGIDRALADGHVVIVQKREATGPNSGKAKVAIGRAERAEFDNKTGDVILRGNPRLQQEMNEHVATSSKTYFILGRDNTLRSVGPSKTLIRQRGSELPGTERRRAPKPANRP